MYFPKPAEASEKIQGHIIEHTNPPLKNAYKDTLPVVSKPISIAKIPKAPNIIKVFAGFSCPAKKPPISTKIQITYKYKSLTSLPRIIFTPKIIPNAIKGSRTVRILRIFLSKLNAPIAPVHLPIIKLPQYKEIYCEIFASVRLPNAGVANNAPILL